MRALAGRRCGATVWRYVARLCLAGGLFLPSAGILREVECGESVEASSVEATGRLTESSRLLMPSAPRSRGSPFAAARRIVVAIPSRAAQLVAVTAFNGRVTPLRL
ncbi:MAG: hypothetical protein FJ284_10345 [Planctomycetes bacterium]|nr:hypothetical protein [Planctomycetota bacterium]